MRKPRLPSVAPTSRPSTANRSGSNSLVKQQAATSPAKEAMESPPSSWATLPSRPTRKPWNNSSEPTLRSGTSIAIGEDERPRGFAHVEFVTAEDCAKAHSACAGKSIDGRQIRLDFSNSKPGRGGGGPRGRGGARGGRGGDRGGRGGGRGGARGGPSKPQMVFGQGQRQLL